jgi:hypothetical protein
MIRPHVVLLSLIVGNFGRSHMVSFAPPPLFPTGQLPTSVICGNFNNDGNPTSARSSGVGYRFDG